LIAREAATGRSDAKRSSPRLRPAPRSVKSWLPAATGSGGPSPAPYPPTEGTTSTCLLQSCPRDPEEAPPLELAGGTQPSSHRPRRSSRVVPQGRRLWTWFAAIGCLEALRPTRSPPSTEAAEFQSCPPLPTRTWNAVLLCITSLTTFASSRVQKPDCSPFAWFSFARAAQVSPASP